MRTPGFSFLNSLISYLKAEVVPLFSEVIWFVAKVSVADPEPFEPFPPLDAPAKCVHLSCIRTQPPIYGSSRLSGHMVGSAAQGRRLRSAGGYLRPRSLVEFRIPEYCTRDSPDELCLTAHAGPGYGPFEKKNQSIMQKVTVVVLSGDDDFQFLRAGEKARDRVPQR
jgi:hypothetical protein